MGKDAYFYLRIEWNEKGINMTDAMKNRWLELHDSKVHEIRISKKNLILVFSEAYVHQSSGKPGHDRGTGWSQKIELEFYKASLDGIPKGFPDRISDGEMQLGGIATGGISIPFASKENARLSLIFQSGNEIQIFGQKMELRELGEPEYLEEFPGN